LVGGSDMFISFGTLLTLYVAHLIYVFIATALGEE
jgi:hypothetical protein